MIYTAHKKKTGSNLTKVVMSDKRGKHHNRPLALTEDQKNRVRDHINCFPTMESHYCRETTERLFLEEGLSISLMYRMYQEKLFEEKIKYIQFQSYRQIFLDEFNYGFFHPKKDRLVQLII